MRQAWNAHVEKEGAAPHHVLLICAHRLFVLDPFKSAPHSNANANEPAANRASTAESIQPMSVVEISALLERVVHVCEQECQQPPSNCVSALTTQTRTIWAKVRFHSYTILSTFLFSRPSRYFLISTTFPLHCDHYSWLFLQNSYTCRLLSFWYSYPGL